MDPSQPHADQNGHQPPLSNGLNVAPPVADDDQYPSPQIAGIERFEEAVGRAVGGTVIPSDIRPNDLPSAAKLDAQLAEKNPVPPSQQQAAPASDEKAASPTIKQNGVVDKEVTASGAVLEDPKN